MPRAPYKVNIYELPEGQFRFEPITQSTARRARILPSKDALLEHMWQLITLMPQDWVFSYHPIDEEEEEDDS